MLKSLAGAAALAFGLCATLSPIPAPDGSGSAGLLHFSSATAQQPIPQDRRVSRRTARRTTNRNTYYNALPAGCVRRNAYWYCGGVYYQPVVQNGATVYIIVNP